MNPPEGLLFPIDLSGAIVRISLEGRGQAISRSSRS